MIDPGTSWFPELAPPPGGERRLRQAMRAPGATPAWRWAPLATACTALVVALAVWPSRVEHAPIDRALRTAWAVPDTPRIEHGHSREVASGDPEVRLYLVTLSPVPVRR